MTAAGEAAGESVFSQRVTGSMSAEHMG